MENVCFDGKSWLLDESELLIQSEIIQLFKQHKITFNQIGKILKSCEKIIVRDFRNLTYGF